MTHRLSQKIYKNPQGAIMSLAQRNIDHFIREQRMISELKYLNLVISLKIF